MKKENENEIIQKAYRVDFSKIVEGEFCEAIFGEYCYAESKYEAGKKLYTHFLKRGWDGLELTNRSFLNEDNVPVCRYFDLDMVFYDGRVITEKEAFHLEILKEHREQVSSILEENPKATHFYLTKAKMAYYLDENEQYTTKKNKAKIYTREEAIQLSMNDYRTLPIPIDNKKYNDELRNKFLPEDVT